MRGQPAQRRALAAIGAALLVALVPGNARAGQYTARACLSNSHDQSASATGEFAAAGMRNVNRCLADQGVLSGNDVREGAVRRGSRADVVLGAPAGTRFLSLSWSGEVRREDCRYTLQVWADSPGTDPIPIVNVRANEGCPRRGRAQAKRIANRAISLNGATRIVQRITCAGDRKRKACSGRGTNFVRTTKAELTVEDDVAPSIEVGSSGALFGGQWTRGVSEVVWLSAKDNTGVANAAVRAGHEVVGSLDSWCRREPDQVGVFSSLVPCRTGGHIQVNTARAPEGTQTMLVEAWDVAGNVSAPHAFTARIDRTPPARVVVGVDGSQGWRNRDDVVLSWTNPPEPDRAPIVGASYKLCPEAGGPCRGEEVSGPDLSQISLRVPSPGRWTAVMWRRDAAGNHDELTSSTPVVVGYDPDPPTVEFEPRIASDPTLLAVRISDAVSGIADAAVEISQTGSGVWRALPVERTGDRVLARVDDAGFPAGEYHVRARVVDQAGNATIADARADGTKMALTLPLRIAARLESAFERMRTVRQRVRRDGRTRSITERVAAQTQTARLLFGESADVVGKLVNPDGSGIPAAQIHVFASTPLGAEEPVGVVSTDAEGRYRYSVAGTTNRTLRFAYVGTGMVLPAESRLTMTVPATTAFKVNRQRLRNGQAVTFSGPVQTLPTPPGGKLVEMQVRLPGRWETFRTIRSDDTGRWSATYRFRRTAGVQHYRFRARLPAEGAYAFVTGVSPVITVRVRGS